MMQCLALDIGSTTIKGAVLDVAGDEVGQIQTLPFPTPSAGLPPLHCEVDPHEIETATRDVIESLVRLAPDAKRLYVAGQMGGLILVDSRGEPLTGYVSWQDQRTQAVEVGSQSSLAKTRQLMGDESFNSLGRELQAGSTLALLHWFSQRDRLPPRATPLTIADYLVSRLCGTPGHMHCTQAVGLLDLPTLAWHRDVFERLGLCQLDWPRLVDSIAPAGECVIDGRPVTVYGSYGDQQCALLGVGLERGELSINISTGSQVSCRTERLGLGDAQTRPFFHGDLLTTVTHLPAGRSLNVFVRLLTEVPQTEGPPVRDVWSTITRLTEDAERASEANRMAGLSVDLSFYATPHSTTGRISGITTENLTVGQLFLGAFRNMADNYARAAARLASNNPWRQIVLSGSLARSVPTLRHMIQQQFPVPMRESPDEEETMRGLLELAKADHRAQPSN